jgi:polyphenol oxidase
LKFRIPSPKPLASSGILLPPNNKTATTKITSNSGSPIVSSILKRRLRRAGGLQWDLLERGEDQVFRAETLARLGWLTHGFGTRLSENWPASNGLAFAKQIHSDRVLRVESEGPQGEGDALISNVPGIALTIRTADCLPILMADPKSRAVAAIHAGWRGVVSKIAPKAVQAMTREFGTRPEDLVIAIGPGIGPCCFEVGPEVAVQFGLSGRSKVDLAATVCQQLGRNGVESGQISVSELCSYCDSQLFESYRRDREAAGRMVGMIGVVGAH